MNRVLVILSCFFAAPVIAQTPNFVGRTGCATATCHGGLIGDGPVWHSSASRWESSDPHRAAGEVLLSEYSRRIVAGLEFTSTKNEEVFANVLKERCVSCHAPEAHPPKNDVTRNVESSFSKQLSRGVGCESCHGPASTWEKLHTQIDWQQMNQFDVAIGMRETEPLLARVDNCSRCHVGSRTADNSVRDMNHDMIAAGHPVLAFDMYRYESALPAHWDISQSAFSKSSPTKLVSLAAAARSRVLSATARLSIERSSAPSEVPRPELSEFDCTACHHQLSVDSRRTSTLASGFPTWNSWLVVGSSLNLATDELRFDRIDLDQRIVKLASEAERRSQLLLRVDEADPLHYLNALLSQAMNNSQVRTQIASHASHARVWFDQIEIATKAASSQLSEANRDRVAELLGAFRTAKLGENPGQPISNRILSRTRCDARDVEELCIELISAIRE